MNQNKKIVLTVIVFGIVVFFAAGHPSSAADLGVDKKIVNVDFPCPDGSFGLGDCQPNDSIPNYLNNIYKFAVGIAGLLALGMIVAGGVYYTISAGSSDKQKEAKDMITSAVLGVAMLLGSYLILKTINPQIVTLNLNFTDISGGELQEINPESSLTEQGGDLSVNCPKFSDIQISPSTVQGDLGNTCEFRKNILKNSATLNNDDGYYDDDSWVALGLDNTTIDAGSIIWTYPYYTAGSPKDAKCIIYAFRETNEDTNMINIDSEVNLCPGQDQKTLNYFCDTWTLKAEKRDDGKMISVDFPVNGDFNYPDLTKSPYFIDSPRSTINYRNWPQKVRGACPLDGGGILNCQDMSWSCTKKTVK